MDIIRYGESQFSTNKKNSDFLGIGITIAGSFWLHYVFAAYGDYWRFTPECISLLYEENGLELLYINYNNNRNQSVYVITVASKNPGNWKNIKEINGNKIDCFKEKVGHKVVSQNGLYHFYNFAMKLLQKIKTFNKKQIQ